MKGFAFSEYRPEENDKSPFEQLLDLFMQLLQYTNGDAGEALNWLTQLDREHGLTTDEYGIGDFIEDLKKNGYLQDDTEKGGIKITAKSEQTIRKRSLDEIFGKLKKTKSGNHQTFKTGQGDEISPETRAFEFGDTLESIDFTGSIRNAYINHGVDQFSMHEDDLEIHETDFKTQTSTVLMIDISHSMILYGEDRITPAKKVAMALSELITTRYPKDTLDIVVFGNDAWQIEMKDLPYLEVGPYHTNTVAGLELAMDLLRRRKNPNKQIFMITDGKPTCPEDRQEILQEQLRHRRQNPQPHAQPRRSATQAQDARHHLHDRPGSLPAGLCTAIHGSERRQGILLIARRAWLVHLRRLRAQQAQNSAVNVAQHHPEKLLANSAGQSAGITIFSCCPGYPFQARRHSTKPALLRSFHFYPGHFGWGITIKLFPPRVICVSVHARPLEDGAACALTISSVQRFPVQATMPPRRK